MKQLREIEFTVPLRELDSRDSAEMTSYLQDRVNALKRRIEELEAENAKLRFLDRDPGAHL